MDRRRTLLLSILLVTAVSLLGGTGIGAQPRGDSTSRVSGASAVVPEKREAAERVQTTREMRVTQEEREAAAERMKFQARLLGSSTRAPAPGPGDVPDYFGTTPNWAFSPPIRKFVNDLPGLGSGNANNLGQYLSIANPDTITYP